MPVPARVYGYCRVSSDHQADDGTSLDGQRAAIERWCRERGYPAPILRVEVESGAEEHRAELARLLAEVRSGDAVVVSYLDRWSRDVVFGVGSIRRLIKAGVGFHAIHEQIDAATPHGDEQLGLRLWFAESERRRILARTWGRREALRAAGLWATGHVPFGYRRAGLRVDRKHLLLEEDPLEGPVVRELFRRAVSGETLRDLATWGRSEHPRAPRAQTGVHALLRRRTYLGEIQVRGTWQPGAHPPLVDRATFERASVALHSRAAGGRPAGQRLTADLLLAPLLRCAICGRKCGVSEGNAAIRYYVCAARRAPRDYPAPCLGPYARVEALDEAAEAALLARLEGLREQLAAAPAEEAPPEDFAKKRAAVQTRIDRAVRLAVDGTISAEDLRRQRARLDVEIGDLARREEEAQRRAAGRSPVARAGLAEALADLAGTWARLDVPERREALRLLAARVELGEDRGRPKSAALDLDAPVASLRRLAGLTQVQLAERRDIGQGSVSTAEKAGDGISLATLRAYAAAAGLELEITVRAAKEGGER